MSVTDRRPTPLSWWMVEYVTGGGAGTRLVRAPDAVSAQHDLREHPSEYGLPYQSVVVGGATHLCFPVMEPLQ
jgi:hypothetical protein